jgi:hypothetical protein
VRFGDEDPEIVAFSPDGRFLAAVADANFDLEIFAVDPHTGVLRRVAAMSSLHFPILGVAFDPTGRFVALADGGVQILGFNRRTGAVRSLPHSSYPVSQFAGSVLFNPAGNLLAVTRSGNADVLLYTMNRRTGRLSKTAEWNDRSHQGSDEPIFTPDGRRLIVPYPYECAVGVLSVEHRHKIQNVASSPFVFHPCDATVADIPVALSPAGTMIASWFSLSDSKGELELLSFDEQTGAVGIPLGSPIRTGQSADFQTLAFSPNAKFLVVGNAGGDSGRETVRVFSVPPACTDPEADNDCDP